MSIKPQEKVMIVPESIEEDKEMRQILHNQGFRGARNTYLPGQQPWNFRGRRMVLTLGFSQQTKKEFECDCKEQTELEQDGYQGITLDKLKEMIG